MISPISFGSTYKVSSGSNFPLKQQVSYDALKSFCDKRCYPYNENSTYSIKQQYGNSSYKINTTIVIPDKEDTTLETFCANKGIEISKFERNKIMTPEKIYSRINPAPVGYRTTLINSNKFTGIIATQNDNDYNATHEKYERQDKKEADFMLQSGDSIPAATLSIKSSDNDKLKLRFVQKTDTPDDCMYFAMKKAGMEDIPVYMDNDSYNMACNLGLVKQ